MLPRTSRGDRAETARILSLWPWALLVVAGVLVLLPRLGAYGFWDPWEPKYAEAAREMRERHSYFVPYYLDDVRLTKPILVYWGILAGSVLFGLNEFGARIVGVGFALATLLGVYYAVSQLRGRMAGLVAALVLCTAPHFYFIARQAMPDVYLLTSVGMCLLFLGLGLCGPATRRDLHFAASYACFALAVLAKGPMIIGAIVLPTLLIWLLTRVDFGPLWEAGRRGPALRCGLALGFGPLVLLVLFVTAYLFGTSSVWWGYSDHSRQAATALRAHIEEVASRAWLAELILLAIGLGAAGWGVRTVRRVRAAGAPFPRQALAPAFAGLAALVGLATAGPESRILLAALLGGAACCWFCVTATVELMRQPWLWPELRPWVRAVGRQLCLFVVVFVIVAGPWHAVIFAKQHEGYVTDFILKHNIGRAGDTVNRSGEADFYLRVLIFGLFPWCGFLPVAFGSLVGWWDREALRRRSFEVFLLVASLVTFTVFSVSATKFTHYLAPMVVPACVLIGLTIVRTFEDRSAAASRLTWIVATLLFMPPMTDILGKNGTANLVESFTMKRWVPSALDLGGYFVGVVAATGLLLLASIVVRSRVILGALLVAALALARFNTGTFEPALTPHKTMKGLCESWKHRAPGGDPPICFFGDVKHGVYFYTENRIRTVERRQEFEEFMDPAHPAYCIVERETLPTLQSNLRSRYGGGAQLIIVDNTHFQYVLVSNYRPPDPH